MPTRFDIEPLGSRHDRSGFDCGSEPLNRYFAQQVTQDIRRRLAACFVAVTSAGAIAGYYTLAFASVPLAELPRDTAKTLPRYPLIPAVRMGRLAVDRQFKGLGLSAALLADALTKALSSDIAAFALIVDAKDDAAATFYRHHGIIASSGDPLAMFLPLATAKALPRG